MSIAVGIFSHIAHRALRASPSLTLRRTICPTTTATSLSRLSTMSTTNMTTTGDVSVPNPTSTSTTSGTASAKQKTVTEGSCHMCFAADEETAVFYNPVQVQNRDLSVLMISLYAERRQVMEDARRAKRAAKVAAAAKEKELKRGAVAADTPSSDSVATDAPKVELSILDALAASGLRSMRYWKECPNVRHVTINDLDPAAHDRATTNIDSNGLSDHLINIPDGRPRGIRIRTGDATNVMYNSRKSNRKRPHEPIQLDKTMDPAEQASRQWDVIDLDPYGSAAPFLDSAVQAICHGGMLNVTCTDMVALGGSHPETCFGRYGSIPITRAGYLQEMAVRILLYTLATTAARYGRTIKPILSVGMDFYIRVFVEVYDDKAGVNSLSLKVGCVHQSTQCPSFRVTPSGQMGGKKGTVYQPGRLNTVTCTETGSSLKVAGPIWLGPMHDQDVLRSALERLKIAKTSEEDTLCPDMKWIATRERLCGLLTSCYEELPDAPLFYRVPDLTKTIHVSSPTILEVRSALVNAGYKASGYHKDPTALKTTAPSHVVWDVFRAWAKKNPPLKPAPETSAAAKILAKETSIEVDFSPPQSVLEERRAKEKESVSRFPMNPTANWGPKKAATGLKRKADSEPLEGQPK